MIKAAADKANARLNTARQALLAIQNSTSFSEFEPAWVAFITALNTIYTVLEQGAKSNSTSRQWYGGKKRERREDPLLQYLHQARNAEEHGIAPITQHEPGSLFVGVSGESVHIEKMTIDGSGNVKMRLKPVNGKLPTVMATPPQTRLVTVRDDRFGTTFDPPTTHLGKNLTSGSPLEVANLGMAYHEGLVSDATSMAMNTS